MFLPLLLMSSVLANQNGIFGTVSTYSDGSARDLDKINHTLFNAEVLSNDTEIRKQSADSKYPAANVDVESVDSGIDDDPPDKCNGGNPIEAWNFVIEHGAVTGGRYFEIETCRPYPFHPCGKVGEIDYGPCPEEGYETPKCRKSCVQNYLAADYLEDKHYGLSAYTVNKNEKEIRREIAANGPVQATFLVYTDFQDYTSGIYRHTHGELEGSQSVKIIGWGSEGGTDFWLLANSRGETWGEKGYFRMIRGDNECGLEEHVVAGQMKD